MTENNGNDRRRDIKGRIDTLGTGTNGVSGRRAAHRIGDRLDKRRTNDETERAEKTAEASLADEEAEDDDEAETEDADVGDEDAADDDDDGPEVGSEGFDGEGDEELGDDAEFGDEDESGEADSDEGESDEDDEDDEDAPEFETRAEDVDERSSLEVEIDPFVRAYAARRAAEKGDESLDEYIVGSVKGYLAGLLGGDVSSPGTLEREVDLEADDIFGGLLEAVAEDDESAEDVVIAAVAEAYDVPVDEDSLVVAGLRDHEALLNGVVANTSNDLDDISEVVQAAVETRLIEEPA